jgi:uncharacterized membrane protein
VKISEESKRWVELGIIDDSAREGILALYPKKRAVNLIYVLFAVLGSLFLGLGIIMIFAVNWANIPRDAKLCISFMPLVGAMCVFIYTLLKRYGSAAFREGSALGLCLSVFATVALVGQAFQTQSDMQEFLRVCTFLALPAVYIMESKASAALYVVCAIISGVGEQSAVSIFSMVVFTPFAVWQIKKTGSTSVAGYFSVLHGAMLTFAVFNLPFDSFEAIIFTFLACAVILLAHDATIKAVKKTGGTMPLTPLACCTILFILMLTSFHDIGNEPFPYGFRDIAFFAVSLVIYAASRLIKQRFSLRPADVIVLCALLGLPMYWLWSNLLLAALGIWLIIDGVGKEKMRVVNYGMLLLISVILARFFDSDLGLAVRGLAFIIIGAGFIAANVLLHRRWKTQ